MFGGGKDIGEWFVDVVYISGVVLVDVVEEVGC